MGKGVHSEAYRGGFDDYLRHPDAYRNPYSHGTQEFNDYERGWSQAIKRYPKQPVTQGSSRRRPVPRSIEPTKEQLSPEQQAIADAYRKLK